MGTTETPPATRPATIDWTSRLAEQLDWHWNSHLRPRLDGLTDAELHWEPVPGCWGIRPRAAATTAMAAGAGDWVADFADLEAAGSGGRAQPEPAPVTTIAWRLGHVTVGCLGMRAANHFGSGGVDYQTTDCRPRPPTRLLAWTRPTRRGWARCAG